MYTLHTGSFARLLAALAVVGLLLGGATTSVMAMPMGNMAVLMASADNGLAQQDDVCEHTEQAHNSDCADTTDAYQCDSGVDCCPHAGTALPVQIDVAVGNLLDVQTAAPQWRVTSVTPVTEIRPPISTL